MLLAGYAPVFFLHSPKICKKARKIIMLGFICTVLSLVASWMIFKKMGRQGWEGIVPCYNMYVLCEELYGNGWKFLLMLIPLYNIYFCIKLYIDWAKAFNMGVGFGIGMILLPFIFYLILAFGSAQYGNAAANTDNDFVVQVVDKTRELASSAVDTIKDKLDQE